jgi:hypothetical protein
MIVTKEFMEKGISSRGGWTKKQVQCLGFPTWQKGWFKRCIGKEISNEDAQRFIALKRKIPQPQNANGIKIDGFLSFKEQYQHPNWQKKRLEIMQRDEFKCMICGDKNKMLHIHHNTYDGKYIWDCNSKSMITLCLSCHELYHNRKLSS